MRLSFIRASSCRRRHVGTARSIAALLGLALLYAVTPLQATGARQPPEQVQAVEQMQAVEQVQAVEDPQEAFLDHVARTLVEGARAARDSASLGSYTARLHERQLVQFIGQRSSHVVQDYRQSLRFRWSREDAGVIRLDNYWARHRALADNPVSVVGALSAVQQGLDPWQTPFRYAFAMLPDVYDRADPDRHQTRFVSPLGAGAERSYRYRSGDTLSVALPDGEVVRAVSVVATPRRRAVRFFSAILWIDAESFGLVRIALRPAKRIDQELVWCVWCEDGSGPGVFIDLGDTDEDAGPEDGAADSEGDAAGPDAAADSAKDDKIGFLRRLANATLMSALPKVELGVASVVVDYAKWNSQHWLPRSMTWLGFASPVDEFVANEEAQDLAAVVRLSTHAVFEIEEIREAEGENAETAAQVAERWTMPGDTTDAAATADPSSAWIILPPDSLAAASDPLGDGIWDEEALAGGGEAGRMASALAALEAEAAAEIVDESSRWIWEPPLVTLRLLGYTMDEGFIAGTRLWHRFPWGRAVASVSMGTKLREPRATVAVEREFPTWKLRLSAFHDLRPIGLVTPPPPSVEHRREWYAADGVTVRFSSARRNREALSLALFAERHDELGPDTADVRGGASLAWRPWWGGVANRRLQGGGEVSLRGTLGDERTFRVGTTAAVVVGQGAGWSLGLEGGGARTWGGGRRADPWLLDTTGEQLRGHEPPRDAASVVWRARADVQRAVWWTRISIFADWLSIADRQYRSAGAGVVLPGGIRLDMAKGFPVELVDGTRTDPRWRWYVRFDGYL